MYQLQHVWPFQNYKSISPLVSILFSWNCVTNVLNLVSNNLVVPSTSLTCAHLSYGLFEAQRSFQVVKWPRHANDQYPLNTSNYEVLFMLLSFVWLLPSFTRVLWLMDSAVNVKSRLRLVQYELLYLIMLSRFSKRWSDSQLYLSPSLSLVIARKTTINSVYILSIRFLSCSFRKNNISAVLQLYVLGIRCFICWYFPQNTTEYIV